LAGAVHEGGRLQQPGFTSARRLAEELGLRGERGLQLVGQMVDKPEADIVPGGFVFGAGVAEADDQAGRIHGELNEKAAGGNLPAAAFRAMCLKLLGSSFAFSGFGRTTLADDADDDRFVSAVLGQLDTLRQLELTEVNAVANLERTEVDFDELGQVLGQTLDVDFGHDVVDQAAVELDARGSFFVDEVQRHLDVQFVGGINALEVDVQDQRLVGVTCVSRSRTCSFLPSMTMLMMEEWKASFFSFSSRSL
jgi:hypothetical protein